MRKIINKDSSWPLYISIFVITSLSIVACILMVSVYSDRTVREHVFDEMQSFVATQAEIIGHEIGDQFKPLNMLADYIKDSETFRDEEGRMTLEALKKENHFCALGFSDRTGNAINYNGNSIGNISDRDYFRKVVSGESTEYAEYLPKTKLTEEPRFLFSVPVYENSDNGDSNEITGIIFASKEVSVISNVLLSDTLFDGSERIYITDGDYNVLAANPNAEKEIQENDLTSAFQFLRDNGPECRSGGYMAEKNVYVVSTPLGVNQWQVVCVLNRENAEVIFKDLTKSFKDTANFVTLILIVALLYTIVMTHYRILRYRQGERQMINQYSGYRILLEKMNCTFVEYHLKTGVIKANRYFLAKYAGQYPEEDGEETLTMEKLRTIHPEFNYVELDEAIQLVLKTDHPYNYETAISFGDGKAYWIELTLMPQVNLAGRVTDILAAVVETTKNHRNSSEEFIANVPNGIHRCYLNDPIHLEYASQGMCRMLGFTEAGLMEAIAPDWKLSRLVHPDDLEKFNRYIQNGTEKEGRYRCEYRLRNKDGNYIAVLDVMEAKRAVSGVMYGYSSMTDITDFQKAEELANAKLRAAEEEIEKHIVREQTIIAAREKHKQEVAELENQLRNAQLKNSMSQMQPHFLYNALASIREIVLDDPEYASDLIYDFSTHLRACIRAMSHDDLVPFEQELDNINAYVNIEKMRFGDKLRTVFDIKDKDFSIVPLSIQPLVENAIRHGVYERGAKGGTVTISTERTENGHIIRVSDDGVGFDYAKLQQEIAEKKRDSTGLTNLMFRLKKIMSAEITVDSTPGTGTAVTVFVPAVRETQAETGEQTTGKQKSEKQKPEIQAPEIQKSE